MSLRQKIQNAGMKLFQQGKYTKYGLKLKKHIEKCIKKMDMLFDEKEYKKFAMNSVLCFMDFGNKSDTNNYPKGLLALLYNPKENELLTQIALVHEKDIFVDSIGINICMSLLSKQLYHKFMYEEVIYEYQHILNNIQ